MADQMSAFRRVIDPDTEWELVESGSPPSVDGFAITETKFMRCRYCGAQVIVDGPGGHQTSIDELVHKPTCPQRDASRRSPADPGDAFDTLDDC
ncbi:hypothetical protein [Halorubrum coriense]|nr:hypothetical protein [Halorubrum coriense]QRG24148.1 hypothetical protein HrrHm1_185 [Halorubrum virus Humcor1]